MPADRITVSLALLLAAAGPAAAHRDPPSCTVTNPEVVLEVFHSDKQTPVISSLSECETIFYVATLRKAAPDDASICAVSGGSFTLVTPDGIVHTISGNVTCIGGTGACSDDALVSDAIEYAVNPDDLESGFLTAVARYADGTSHTGTTHPASVSEEDTLKNIVVFCSDGGGCTIDECDPSVFGPPGCSNTLAPSTHLCRPAAGICDFPEFCSGTNALCPSNSFKTPVNTCRPSAGSCDAIETCPGGSADCPADKLNNSLHVCRAAAGACDVQEKCTGTSVSCPSNVFSPTTLVCRSSAGVCDLAETCSGTSASCPLDALAGSTVLCRASSAVCDAEERCTSLSASCPADQLATTATLCRPATALCDAAEACSGTSTACPKDAFEKDSTVCRAAATPCDKVETCVGTSAACDPDGFTTGNTCRPKSSTCDVAETCAGTSVNCPADAFSSSTVTCRPSTGVCDPVERCTGTSSVCPASVFLASTTACRPAAGECDAVERCTGSSGACPGDVLDPALTACTSDGEPCTDDVCNGASSDCTHPASNPVPCDDGLFCNGTDVCAGGTCSTHNGNPCPLPDSDGDCTEACNEATDDCTAPDPNDTNCTDGDDCTQGDTCQAGECIGNAVPGCTTTTTLSPDPLCGDANQDGNITAPDALLALRTAVGTGDCPEAICDYNGNGQVQSSDALSILRVAVGQPVPPQCPGPSLAASVSTTLSTTTTTLLP